MKKESRGLEGDLRHLDVQHRTVVRCSDYAGDRGHGYPDAVTDARVIVK